MEVRMRNRIIMLLISLLLIGTIQLTADTIIDTIYAIGSLTGTLIFSQANQCIVFNDYTLNIGDTGDTMYCIMDHIDYGDYIDPGDWTAGDVGDPGTLSSNIGIISDSGIEGHRYLNITPYVQNDYDNNRNKTQYRIRFPIDTDWDSFWDYIHFSQGSTPTLTNPGLIMYFTSINSVDENNLFEYNINIFPNPFINSTIISFHKRQGQVREVGVYNLKGQLVKRLGLSYGDLGCRAEWDGTDEAGHEVSNGIYLIRVESKNDNIIRRVMKIR